MKIDDFILDNNILIIETRKVGSNKIECCRIYNSSDNPNEDLNCSNLTEFLIGEYDLKYWIDADHFSLIKMSAVELIAFIKANSENKELKFLFILNKHITRTPIYTTLAGYGEIKE